MSSPLNFGIIMPTFHRPTLLHAAIDQVLAQTYPYWYLLIVDSDGALWPDSYVNDARVEMIGCPDKDRCSAAAARNLGLRYLAATRDVDIIVFLDDDDTHDKTLLEEFATAFADAPADVELVRCLIRNHDGTVLCVGATPTNAIRAQAARANWGTAAGYHSDREYFAQYKMGAMIPKILVEAGHADTGGLRHPEGGL